MDLQERRELVQQAKLSFNCLRASHPAKSCPSKSVCHTPDCKQRHHTLLCPKASKVKETLTTASNPTKDPPTDGEEQAISSLMAAVEKQPSIPVFPTAVVQVRKEDGTFARARVLIDSGAQASMVTEDCLRKLGLVRRYGKLVVTGIGQQAAGTTRGIVTLHLASRFNEVIVISTSAYVLGKLTSSLPSQRFNSGNLKLLENVRETFNKPGQIDVILGSDVFLALLEGGQVKDNSGQTVAHAYCFRMDRSGTIRRSRDHARESWHCEFAYEDGSKSNAAAVLGVRGDKQATSVHSLDHFNSTTQRDSSGRFVVKLPFDDSKPALEESLSAAMKRLFAMEKRFASNPEFRKEYVSFMREYLELGHMEPVPANQVVKIGSEHYYLPHHAVIRVDSSTTRLRVVFDASCATSTGISLNDRLLAGPNINEDLLSVHLRFRSYKVAFCADVAKMYRQVVMHEEDRDFLRIVWREDSEKPVEHYRLSMVTYGTKTAPYLAIQAMRESTIGYETTHPEAVKRIIHDFYVDDALSGADNEEEAMCIKEQITEILSKSGFELRKWTSSCPKLLENEVSESVPVKLSDDADVVKALGIYWYPSEDQFGFKVNFSADSVNTKRQMISDASRLFDPFGCDSENQDFVSTIVTVRHQLG
ncbi:uncharacterized protein LOC135704713 [Ochlerotatus camptorhynchus]|uniref:uncharacterized protein LOC135704713 n=1 Tax=Ochlerotatus camptorhynchus TaxID=644619 RepID=UPI0031DB1F54